MTPPFPSPSLFLSLFVPFCRLWTNNGGVELPLEDWQYKVIAQVLGLSIQEDKNGNITFSHFPKDFVMKRMEKMGILIPVDGGGKCPTS